MIQVKEDICNHYNHFCEHQKRACRDSEMAQLVKDLPHSPDGLSSVPRVQVKVEEGTDPKVVL